MSDIQINKDLFLDSFYDQDSDSDASLQDNEESFLKQFRTLKNIMN